MKALPPWAGLRIEDKVMSVYFTDANKFRDVLKVCIFLVDGILVFSLSFQQMFIFISHNVLTEKESPHGYHLLCCLRAYLDLTMWEALEVHTEETIASGREAVTRLGKLMSVSDFPWKAISIDLFIRPM